VHVEALEHFFFDVFDVSELAPTSDIAVFTGALKLHNEFCPLAPACPGIFSRNQLGLCLIRLLIDQTLLVLVVYCFLFLAFVVLDPAKPEPPEEGKIVEPSPNVNPSWP
jgi:hypothetical protein